MLLFKGLDISGICCCEEHVFNLCCTFSAVQRTKEVVSVMLMLMLQMYKPKHNKGHQEDCAYVNIKPYKTNVMGKLMLKVQELIILTAFLFWEEQSVYMYCFIMSL